MNAEARFWAKVDKSGECWLWTGSTTRGYGTFRAGPINGITYAHRFSLALTGVNVTGLQVDHMCHVRACVRPEHLRVATNKQNHENLAGAYANSRTGVRGVWWDERANQWHATVQHDGIQHRKRFKIFEEAEAWAVAKRLELFTHNDADRISA